MRERRVIGFGTQPAVTRRMVMVTNQLPCLQAEMQQWWNKRVQIGHDGYLGNDGAIVTLWAKTSRGAAGSLCSALWVAPTNADDMRHRHAAGAETRHTTAPQPNAELLA